jgi:8-oxo-dGTP pyrophosphatase MutT (NUDIX family)
LTRTQALHDAGLLMRYLRATLPTDVPDAAAAGPASARVAAVLAPLYAINGEPWLIFTRRTETLRSHSGQISFPGGQRDATDATLWETALREAEEEVALPQAGVTAIGALPPLYAAVSNNLVQPYMGWLGEGRPALAPNPAEVAEIIHLPLRAIADPTAFHDEIWRRNGETHVVNFYDVGAYRIWGLTGSIVHSLLATLPPA